MSLTPAMEDYLKAVLVLHGQNGSVRCVEVAEYLGVTKPSVSRAVKELSKTGHIRRTAHGALSLTEQGRHLAEQLYERHCFFTARLIKAGVDPQTAAHDACHIEHAISAEAFQKLKASLEERPE